MELMHIFNIFQEYTNNQVNLWVIIPVSQIPLDILQVSTFYDMNEQY